MKSYTNLEQSNKLAKILPLETADMEYMFLKRDGSMVSIVPFIKDGCEESDCSYNFVHCWSLAALLDILPNKYGRGTKTLYWFDDAWHCDYMDVDGDTVYGVTTDSPIDAVYKMIVKLHEEKLL